MTYSELQVATHFCFLRGVSSCEELFTTASEMRLPALGITDRNSVAGIVRAMVAAEKTSAQGNPVRMVAAAGSISSPARRCSSGRRISRHGAGSPGC